MFPFKVTTAASLRGVFILRPNLQSPAEVSLKGKKEELALQLIIWQQHTSRDLTIIYVIITPLKSLEGYRLAVLSG